MTLGALQTAAILAVMASVQTASAPGLAVGDLYVSLGSSYAAGVGLGPVVPSSPPVCDRSNAGYPSQVAKKLGLKLVDASCSAATMANVLLGGQAGLGPQVDALNDRVRLVTLTAGGNDVSYVGDMMRLTLGGPGQDGATRSVDERPYEKLRTTFVATLRDITRRAPNARILVLTYPAVIPSDGTCDALKLTADQAALFRGVADRLASITRQSALESGATVVDIARLSKGHDACSSQPWVAGAYPTHGVPFHPNLAGAIATAEAVERLLQQSQ